MKKYIIEWDCGYGPTSAEVEAETEDQAMEAAYEAWKDDAESNASYKVIGEATDKLREEYL